MMHAAAVDLTIVIPAYREGLKIQSDIRAASSFLRGAFGGTGEIFVVDDGSPDDTARCACRLQDEVPELRVVRHLENRGKGFALRTGVAASRGRRVMFADAGTCVPYDDALPGIAMVDRGVHFAHGSRRAPGSVIRARQPSYRRLGSRVFRTLARTFMGIPHHLKDTQCGFKVYDGDTARRLFGECFTDGFMLDIELIRRAHRRGLEIREFPVHWRNDRDTRFRPVRGTLRNLRELIRIRSGVSRNGPALRSRSSCC